MEATCTSRGSSFALWSARPSAGAPPRQERTMSVTSTRRGPPPRTVPEASGRRQTSPPQGVLLYCRELEARGRGARGEDDEEGRLDLPERLPAGREVQDRRFPGSRIEAQGRARAGQLERTVQERDTIGLAHQASRVRRRHRGALGHTAMSEAFAPLRADAGRGAGDRTAGAGRGEEQQRKGREQSGRHELVSPIRDAPQARGTSSARSSAAHGSRPRAA